MKRIWIIFSAVMIVALSFLGSSKVLAESVELKEDKVVKQFYSEDQPSGVSDYLMDDFLNNLADTADPEVKKDELGNIYKYNEDGSLEIDVQDPITLQKLTGDYSVKCIACVGGVKVTLKKSGSKYKSYGAWNTGVEGKYPLTPIKFSKSVSWSNSYSGGLQASVASLSATSDINVTKSGTATAGTSLPLKKGEKGLIKYRTVWNNQKVTQTITMNGKHSSTKTIIAKGYSHIQYDSKVWK